MTRRRIVEFCAMASGMGLISNMSIDGSTGTSPRHTGPERGHLPDSCVAPCLAGPSGDTPPDSTDLFGGDGGRNALEGSGRVRTGPNAGARGSSGSVGNNGRTGASGRRERGRSSCCALAMAEVAMTIRMALAKRTPASLQFFLRLLKHIATQDSRQPAEALC